LQTVSHEPKNIDAPTLLANAVSAKNEDGNIRHTIRIICSDDNPATDTEEAYAQLLDKHPSPPTGCSSTADPRPTVALQVWEAEVL